MENEPRDFDPLDTDHVDAVLKENGVEVSLDGPIAVFGNKPMDPDAWESMKEWHFGWKHGGMSLMRPDRQEYEARSAAALFVTMWNAKTGMNPGTLRDIAVIYVERCYEVHRMNEEASAFLKEVASLDREETTNALCSLVYRKINELMCEGKFEHINCILRDFRPEKHTASCAMAFLGSSNQLKKHLPARADVYRKAHEACAKLEGIAEAHKKFWGFE